MCRCFTSDCPGVRIPGEAPIWCLGNLYVFNVKYCENPDSGDCIRTYHPDPRGNPDQCPTCARTQRAIYPEGLSLSKSDKKVHVMKHPAPNGPPPAYRRHPEYEDSEIMAVQRPTAAAGPEQPLRARLHVPRTVAMVLILPPRDEERSPSPRLALISPNGTSKK